MSDSIKLLFWISITFISLGVTIVTDSPDGLFVFGGVGLLVSILNYLEDGLD